MVIVSDPSAIVFLALIVRSLVIMFFRQIVKWNALLIILGSGEKRQIKQKCQAATTITLLEIIVIDGKNSTVGSRYFMKVCKLSRIHTSSVVETIKLLKTVEFKVPIYYYARRSLFAHHF
jgi:hypothetical protein